MLARTRSRRMEEHGGDDRRALRPGPSRALGRRSCRRRRPTSRRCSSASSTPRSQSRHLDFAARWLQKQGKGYYTIGSAGHESNAAVGLLSRTTDPALLHYRSGGFYAARAAVAGTRPPGPRRPAESHLGDQRPDVRRAPQGVRPPGPRHHPADVDDRLPPAQGGRARLQPRPGSAIGHRDSPWPADAIVVCSFGDASVNHSTAAGALNAAAYLTHRRHPVPGPVRLRGQRHRHQHRGRRRGGRRPRSRGFPGSPTGTPTGRTRRRSSTSSPSRWPRSARAVAPPSCT